MTRKYKVEVISGSKIISYEENGFLISFNENPDNSEYQQYLASLNETNEL
jgi:hypothetical protein